MDQEEVLLPDGRKTSELKVQELKNELEKLNKSKAGLKSELLERLNEALTSNRSDEETKKDTDDQSGINNNNDVLSKEIDKPETIDEAEHYSDNVDLDDEVTETVPEVHTDTLVLNAPNDETLVPEEEMPAEDSIEMDDKTNDIINDNITDNVRESTKNEEGIEEKDNENDDDNRMIICKKELNDEGNSRDEMYEVYIDSQIELEERKVELSVISDKDVDKEIMESKKEAFLNENNDESAMEEGEVLPITARLGKRVPVEKKGLKETKVSGYKNEEPIRIQSPRYPRNTESDILRIDNLVRPYTLGQLKEMLNIASGKNVVKDIWLNRIKSVAYVQYDDEDSAINAREKLDGCKWPSINPKLLSVDFTSQKEMDAMKKHGDHKSHNEKRSIVDNKVSDSYKTQKSSHNEETKRKRSDSNSNNHNTRDVHYKRTNDSNNNINSVSRSEKDARHNISDKRTKKRSRSPGFKKDYDDPKYHKSRKSHDNEREVMHKPLPPVKKLEDLFRKTVTQPSIYWLPASKEKKEEIKKTRDGNAVKA